MKRFVIWALVIGMSAAVAMAAPPQGRGRGPGQGVAAGDFPMCGYVDGLPSGELTPALERDIVRLRDDEKLARDVYAELFAAWKLPIFDRIGDAETHHFAAAGRLVEKYGVVEPGADLGPGEFDDPEMQALFHDLVTRGLLSPSDAFWVGATIEDLDIFDLRAMLERHEATDVRFVLQNLLKGSRNHLRSFVGWMASSGETYEAAFLTTEEIAQILESPRERGPYDENGEPIEGFAPHNGWAQRGNRGAGPHGGPGPGDCTQN